MISPMYVCSFMSHLLVIVMHKYKQAMFNRMKYEHLHVSITPLTDSHQNDLLTIRVPTSQRHIVMLYGYGSCFMCTGGLSVAMQQMPLTLHV